MNPDDNEANDNQWQPDPEEEIQDPAPDEEQQPESAPLSPSEQIMAKEDDNPVNWTAREYIHGEKNGLWYVVFVIVVLGLIALDLFFLKSYTFSVLVVVMAIALVVYSLRPPREIQYALSGQHGLYVGEKLYNFADFKAFGLIQDGEHHSIMLIPTKRFSLGVSVYFPEEAGEKIVDILGARLPMRPLKLDAMDLIVRRLRL